MVNTSLTSVSPINSYLPVTCSTVGYGDILVKRSASKLLVSCYALLSCGLIGGLLGTVVDRLVERQHDVGQRLRDRMADARMHDTLSQSKTEASDFATATETEALEARGRFYASLSILLAVTVVGGLIYGSLQSLSVVDTLYLIAATLTTVGYGDHHPVTPSGKMFAILWLGLGTVSLANVLGQWSDFKVRQREAAQAKRLMASRMSEEIYATIDTDRDGRLSEIEYLTFVLARLGKCSVEEVESVRKRFREIDLDGNGFITREEVELR